MTYIYGALLGFAYGALAGALKYLFLWRRMIKNAASISHTAFATGMMISFFVNIAVLLAVYFARNLIPYDFSATVIAAAVGLSIFGKSFSIKKVLSLSVDETMNNNVKENIEVCSEGGAADD